MGKYHPEWHEKKDPFACDLCGAIQGAELPALSLSSAEGEDPRVEDVCAKCAMNLQAAIEAATKDAHERWEKLSTILSKAQGKEELPELTELVEGMVAKQFASKKYGKPKSARYA